MISHLHRFQTHAMHPLSNTTSFDSIMRSLVQAFMHCQLDYCNALLAGIADTQVKRLQSVQNGVAWLVSGARRRDHITRVLRSLHWLPMQRKIIFKTATMASQLPIYRKYRYVYQRRVSQVVLVYSLHRLKTHNSCQESTGQWSFSFHGPTV